jgi:hypothetical protein
MPGLPVWRETMIRYMSLRLHGAAVSAAVVSLFSSVCLARGSKLR